MTILVQWTDGDSSLSVTRDHQEETSTVTIDVYGDTKSITLPTADLARLVRIGAQP